MDELIKMMGVLLFVLKTKGIIDEDDYQLILGKMSENQWIESNTKRCR